MANHQKKFRRALMQIWNALDELVGLPFMPESEVIRMRGIIQPYLKRMVDGLSAVKLSPVNVHPKKSRERSLGASEQVHTEKESECSQEPDRADGAATRKVKAQRQKEVEALVKVTNADSKGDGAMHPEAEAIEKTLAATDTAKVKLVIENTEFTDQKVTVVPAGNNCPAEEQEHDYSEQEVAAMFAKGGK